MLRLKNDHRRGFARRFGRYRTLFLVGAALTLAGFLAAAFLFQTPRAQFSGERAFLPVFFRLLNRCLLALTGTFLLGITVYAPAWQVLLSLAQGFFGGFSFFSLTKGEGSWGEILSYLGFFLLSTWLYLAYGSFCTTVSLRLFTDGRAGSLQEEEARVFGGTLFNSTLFEETLNLRFLFSYTLFFLAAGLVGALLAGGYAYLFSIG